MADYDMALGDRAARIPDARDAAATASGVSWAAILAGAAGAASLSLILLLLGSGLGLSSISPWSSQRASTSTVGVVTILWITFTQIAASGMGGYLAGRLRIKWAGVHTDEVYFRDTAHGFLAWGVATLATAALLTSVVTSMLGAGVQAGASAMGGVATAGTAAATSGAAGAGSSASASSSSNSMNYFIDTLFRSDAVAKAAPSGAAQPSGEPSGLDRGNPAAALEVGRIFAHSIRTGALPPEDAKYVAQLVSQRTGLNAQDAEKRVSETYAKAQAALNEAEAKAKAAADEARKASAYASLWLFISMLIGAFVASFAATYGGRRRDL